MLDRVGAAGENVVAAPLLVAPANTERAPALYEDWEALKAYHGSGPGGFALPEVRPLALNESLIITCGVWPAETPAKAAKPRTAQKRCIGGRPTKAMPSKCGPR